MNEPADNKMPSWVSVSLCLHLLFITLTPALGSLVFAMESGPSKTTNARGIAPETVHVLAIGCCVPWLKAQFCQSTTQRLVNIFIDRMGVPRNNVRTLVDKQATYQGVADGLEWLARSSSEHDTAVIIYVGHGRRLPGPNGNEADEDHEVFWLYLEDMPRTQWFAVNNKIWMTDDAFSDHVRRIRAARKLILVNTCRAGGIPGLNSSEQDSSKTAVITATAAGEDALSLPDDRGSLFTEYLIQAIEEGAPDLGAAFQIARDRTREESVALCAREKHRNCKGQTPQLTDPHGILGMFRFTERL